MEKGSIWTNKAGRQHLMSWLAVLTFDYWTIFPFAGTFLEYSFPIFLENMFWFPNKLKRNSATTG